MPVSPLGPKYCICQTPEDEFVCEDPITGEDFLCDVCREDTCCTRWRQIRANRATKEKENA